MKKSKVGFISYCIFYIIYDILIFFYFYFNPSKLFDIYSIVLLVVSPNTLFLVGLFICIKLLRLPPNNCIICGKMARYILTDYVWGQRRVSRYEIYCLDHFLKKYLEELQSFKGIFIFLKEDKYFPGYIYLSLRDLQIHPAKYTPEDINQVSALLGSIDNICKKCNVHKAKILLINAKIIEYSVQRPLIKDTSLFPTNESLCPECFVNFLANEINSRQSEFETFRLNLPYDTQGIYLFEQ